MKQSILFTLIICCLALADGCKEAESPAEIPEACYASAGLYYWTINDQPEEPGESYEPNTGLNMDFVYSIDLSGNWAIYFTNAAYGVTFADFDELISAKERSNLTEAQWEALLTERGTYAFAYEADGRQELTLYDRSPAVFVGDDAAEVLGGEVKLTIRKADGCQYLVLEVTAQLALGDEAYTVKIKVDQPYVYG